MFNIIYIKLYIILEWYKNWLNNKIIMQHIYFQQIMSNGINIKNIMEIKSNNTRNNEIQEILKYSFKAV